MLGPGKPRAAGGPRRAVARAVAARAESFPGQGTGWVSMTIQYEVSMVPIWSPLKPSFWMPSVSVGSGSDETCGARSASARAWRPSSLHWP